MQRPKLKFLIIFQEIIKMSSPSLANTAYNIATGVRFSKRALEPHCRESFIRDITPSLEYKVIESAKEGDYSTHIWYNDNNHPCLCKGLAYNTNQTVVECQEAIAEELKRVHGFSQVSITKENGCRVWWDN